MSNKKITPEQLDNLYQNKQSNFFTDSIHKIITDELEKESIVNVFTHLKNRSAIEGENIKLNEKEYKLIGAISFLVNSLGDEFSSQDYYIKIISDNICERFKQFNFTKEMISSFLNVFNTSIINDKSISAAKNEIVDVFTREFANLDATQNNKMRLHIKELFKSSIVPVKFAHEINALINTQKHTPQSILKINKAIVENISMSGKSVKHYHALYTTELFINLLNESVAIDSSKNTSIILYNSILTLLEAQKKFNDVDNKNLATIIYFDELAEDEKTEFLDVNKKAFDEKTEQNKVVVAEPIGDDDKEKELFETDKTKFLLKMLEQTNGIAITSIETFTNAIELIFKNNDYAQHVMTYIYENLKYNKFEIKDEYCDFLKSENSVQYLSDYINKIGEKYKELIEKLCQDIDDVTLHKIVNYTNSAIGDCIFETQEQKQKLISQLNENCIKTYKFLLEIVSIMETCNCNNVVSYSVLYDYINSHDVCVDIFSISSEIDEVVTKLKFYNPVLKLVKKLNAIEE